MHPEKYRPINVQVKNKLGVNASRTWSHLILVELHVIHSKETTTTILDTILTVMLLTPLLTYQSKMAHKCLHRLAQYIAKALGDAISHSIFSNKNILMGRVLVNVQIQVEKFDMQEALNLTNPTPYSCHLKSLDTSFVARPIILSQ